VGGAILGVREALLALRVNHFVLPEQYGALYVAVPILAGVMFGILVLLPVGLLRLAVRPAPWSKGYSAILAGVGVASVLVPWAMEFVAELRSVGRTLGPVARLGIVGGVSLPGVLLAAAVGWRVGSAPGFERGVGLAARGIGLVCLALLLPIGQVVVADWRWAGTTASAGADPGLKQAPSLVLVSIDTLRADHLGSYGSPYRLTPVLDQLAQDGVRFANAITTAPWTLPAIASLHTGLYPRHHGAGRITNRRDPLGRSPLPEEAWTLAEELRARGYRTQAIVTNPYLTLRYGLGRGFEGYENLTIFSEAFLMFHDISLMRVARAIWPRLHIGDRGETVTARAITWLERTDRARPFFLWLHYIDPHPPYSRPGVVPHKSFRGDTLPGATNDDLAVGVISPDVARLRSGEIRLSDSEKEAVRDLYRAEVAVVDAAVGRVLDELDRLGLREQTLVVCIADHGEEFWEHGGVEHGHTVYEEIVRVPLLMRWPSRLQAGRVVTETVGTADVVPTVLGLLGVPAPAAVDGRSLVTLADGGDADLGPRVTENMLFAEERVGVRTAHAKYVRWQNGKEEVYDLTIDPAERRDLAGVEPMVTARRAEYAALERGLVASVVPGPIDARLPANLLGLRALGYVR
jgi:arylsulfatase A-like enzyme